MLACWLVLAAAILASGERETARGELEAALSQHRLDGIVLEGSLREGVVHWQDGRMPRVTEVHEGFVRLQPDPDVNIHRVPHQSYVELGSWWLPSWVRGVWFAGGV